MDGAAFARWIHGDPVMLPDGTETIARCAVCGAGMVPRGPRHRYCGEACAKRAKYTAPSRAVGDARRSARFQARHSTWRLAVRALRRAGIDPATVPALEALRGAGRVEGWREMLGLPPERRGAKSAAESAAEATPAKTATTTAPWGAAVGAQPDHVAWGVELASIPASASARHIHGLVAHLVATPHAQVAQWALAMPAGSSGRSGWGVVLFRRDDAERLAGLARGVQLGAQRCELRCGPVVRLRAPPLLETGRYRVIVDAVTPVSHMIAGRTRPVTQPSVDTVLRCAGDLLQRLALTTGRMHVASVACETSAERVVIGGHVGAVTGWVGRIIVECNAPAAWALSLARHAGLGGRVAYGLGRVRVEVQRA